MILLGLGTALTVGFLVWMNDAPGWAVAGLAAVAYLIVVFGRVDR